MFIIRVFSAVFFIGFIFALGDVKNNYAKDTLEETHGTIIYASVVFRHGDRTPDHIYPTSEYGPSFWSEGIGQLNKKGKQRIYDLGKWFRQRYKQTPGLSRGYRYDMLLMNSSDYDRTIMSAELLLAGFLPPNENEMWAEDGLKWQPIPVHSKTKDQDTAIAAETPCERYDLELYKVNQSPEVQEYFRENQEFLEFVANNSGHNISSSNVIDAVIELSHVYDELMIEDLYSLTLPSWSHGIYPAPLNTLFPKMLIGYVLTPEMQKLRAGPILGSIVSDLQIKQSGLSNQTFHFYSGHDTTIAGILYTLGLFNFIAPPYGSAIIIELRLKENDHVVTMLYRNSSETEPYLLSLAGCGDICTLDKFIEIIKPWTVDNWEEECTIGWLEKLFHYYERTIIIVVFLFLLLTFSISIYEILHCCRRRSLAHYEYASL